MSKPTDKTKRAMILRNEDTCLENTICPECGNYDRFKIVFTGLAEVHRNGSEDEGDHEWNDSSNCTCYVCEYTDKLSAFRLSDDEIERLEKSHV